MSDDSRYLQYKQFGTQIMPRTWPQKHTKTETKGSVNSQIKEATKYHRGDKRAKKNKYKYKAIHGRIGNIRKNATIQLGH